MPKIQKWFLQLFLLAVIVFAAVSPAPALAGTNSVATQDGLTVQLESPRNYYREGEYIPLSLSVRNDNEYSLYGITARIKLNGMSLKYGALEQKMQIPAGEESALQPVALKSATPQTGDRQNPWLWIALALLSTGGVLFLCLHRKKTARLLTLLLCAAFACAGQPIVARAGDVSAAINVSLTLMVGDTRVIATGTVTYPVQKTFNIVGGVISGTNKTTGTCAVGGYVLITPNTSQAVAWNLTGGDNVTSIMSDDPLNRTLAFRSNGGEANIKAVPTDGETNYSVTVEQSNGKTTSFAESVGKMVNISASVPVNVSFTEWINKNVKGYIAVHFDNSKSSDTSFTMPSGPVYVQATSVTLHKLTVNGGSGNGWYKAFSTVTVNAGGHLHSGWHWEAVGINLSETDKYKDYFTITMPANDVTITMSP